MCGAPNAVKADCGDEATDVRKTRPHVGRQGSQFLVDGVIQSFDDPRHDESL